MAAAIAEGKGIVTRFGQLVCRTGNIGDDLQSLAACQHLPTPPAVSVNRDKIHRYFGHPIALIMNGWFSGNAEAWPPSPSIYPVFVGFHVCDRLKPAVARHARYLKFFEPIGVRDAATAHFLQSLGVKTETTYCLTLTFPQRDHAPLDGQTFIVDADSIAIPRSLCKGAIRMTHRIPPLEPDPTLAFAQKLLDMYRDRASLVITTRLQAALPCLAMGIPVVFFGSPADGRTAVVNDIGAPIYDRSLQSKAMGRGMLGRVLNRVDWSPTPPDLSAARDRLVHAVEKRLRIMEESLEESPHLPTFAAYAAIRTR